jgi:hypothetical protein
LAITYHAGRRIQGLAPADETYSNTTRTTGQTSYSSNGTTMTHYIGERFTATKWRNVELKTLVVYGSRYTTSSSGDFQLKVFGSDHVTQIGSTITGTPSVSSMPLNSAGVSNTTVTFDLTGITSPNTEFFIGVGTTSTGGAPSYVFYNNAAAGTDGSNMWEEYNGYTNFPSKSMSFTLTYVGGDAKPTNVQTGSRFEETDTRKMYHYNAQVPDYDYPMTTDPRTNTYNTGSVCTITHTNSTLQLNQLTSGGTMGASTYIDLLSNLSNKWVMRFKTKQTGYTSYAYNSQFQVGMSSVAPTSTAYNISSSLNWIGFRWYFGNQSGIPQGIEPRIGQNTGDNAHTNGTSRLYGLPNAVTNTTTPYYHEFIWNVDTFTYNLYTNENYTGTPTATATMSSSTNTQWVTGTPSSISGLRYFVFKEGSDGSGGLWVNQLDDVEIWDGVIVATTGNAWSEEGT